MKSAPITSPPKGATTPPARTMQRFQEAFQGAAGHHFRSETLHCMSLFKIQNRNGNTGVLGLTNKLNGFGTIISKRWITPTRLEITLREGGPLALHIDRSLASASVNGTGIALTPTEAGATILDLPVVTAPTLTLGF